MWRSGHEIVRPAGKQGNGGWQPVVRRHGDRGVGGQRGNTIYSVFVDNIPASMGAKGLSKLFSNFGVVLDAYIPQKRRRSTGSRFGFIRYGCPVAASMALQKANGLWCDDKALKVKMAEFRKECENKQSKSQQVQKRWVKEGIYSVHDTHQGRKSYADVVSGRDFQSTSGRTIKVQKVGNGWLHESVVVRLKPIFSVEDFKEELQGRGHGDITVRVGGGRQLVLSFQSVEAMKEKLPFMKDWLTVWCESVEEWEDSMVLEQVRQVWLSCYGVPLVLWNNNTFCSIGKEWGEVLKLDEDTANLKAFHCGKVKVATRHMGAINHTLNLECKGILYPVRICEEQIIVSQVVKEYCICQSFMRNNADSYSSEEEVENIADRGSRQEVEEDDVEVHMGDEVAKDCDVEEGVRVDAQVNTNDLEEDASLRVVSVVEETDMMEGVSGEGFSRKEGAEKKLCKGVSEKGGARKEGSCRVDDEVVTSGFIRSTSGSVGKQPGINLEVNLNRAHFETCRIGSAQRAEAPLIWADNSSNSITESTNGVGQSNFEFRRVSNNQSPASQE
ncbi:uncharacterized protein LOC114272780 [Camellia sinensis]|uniref:uncharacterized protein LOC114272780 n=1 Tax=Camellia sinensis TaxID=4442 RepID=UPI001035A095|nr:uncharacterized protein LOC114272780 [Camellia sinensis]